MVNLVVSIAVAIVVATITIAVTVVVATPRPSYVAIVVATVTTAVAIVIATGVVKEVLAVGVEDTAVATAPGWLIVTTLVMSTFLL
jgi:hypothetical protein